MTYPFYTNLNRMTTRDPDFRISKPGELYHFGLSVREIESYPGADVRRSPDGKLFVILQEADFADEVVR